MQSDKKEEKVDLDNATMLLVQLSDALLKKEFEKALDLTNLILILETQNKKALDC